MTSRAIGQGWTTEEAQGATFVELFFDLVFVFAITSVTQLLLHDLSWSGLADSVLILWLVWWAWTQFTWTLNPADTNHPAVRVITLAATAVAFFMAQAIPDAFTSAGAWFAFSYVIVRILGLGLQLGLLGRARENSRTVATWIGGSSIGLVAVIAGGLLSSPWREILWVAAVVADLISAAQAGRGSWNLNSAHFAERHGLIVIIALGESLIAAGVALGDVTRDGTFATGTVAAVLAVCGLWWIYFGAANDQLEEFLEAQPPETAGAEGRNIYSWGHLPIIAGIIGFAVGFEQALTHLDEPLSTEALIAMGLGMVLYLGGIAYGVHRSGRSVTPWAVAATVGVIVLIISSQAASTLVPLVGAALIVLAFAAWIYSSTDRIAAAD